MAAGEVDAVATAHTRDDQAETVLAKFLRGAWTEGLSGIHPVVEFPEGRILRPLLGDHAGRGRGLSARAGPGLARGLLQPSSHLHPQPHPPRVAAAAGGLESAPARAPGADGRTGPRRGGLVAGGAGPPGAAIAAAGPASTRWWTRQAGDGLALDVNRLAALAPALQRRLLRYAAEQLGAAPDFPATEALRTLALAGRAGQKLELAQGLCAERTHRELRLACGPGARAGEVAAERCPSTPWPFRARLWPRPLVFVSGSKSRLADHAESSSVQRYAAQLEAGRPGPAALLLRPTQGEGSAGAAEVTGTSRALWPVLELDGRIVWMQGVELEPEPGIRMAATSLETARASDRFAPHG